MDLTRCGKGHFYDSDKFSECPYCNGAEVKDFTETVAYTEDNEVEEKKEQTLEEKIQIAQPQDNDKTLSYYNQVIGSEPVVGWLVCIEGKHFGEDFRLTGGRNFIGRSSSMDVALTGDPSISREKHAVILYEPKQNIFMIQPGDSKELSYLNDKVILQAEVVKAYDVLSMGNTKLMFIPFCSEKFQWDDSEKESKTE